MLTLLKCALASALTLVPLFCESKCMEPKQIYESSVKYQNPCYFQCSNAFEINIPNMSPALFASKDLTGKLIRRFSGKNDVPNPHGLTHAGLIVNLYPGVAHDIILHTELKGKPVGFEKSRKRMLDDIIDHYKPIISATHDPEKKLEPFVLEANGTVEQALSGIYPHTQMFTLTSRLENYNGNVLMRALNADISTDDGQKISKKYIGTSYEASIGGILSMIKATKKKNQTSELTDLFCSELVATVYQDLGVLPSRKAGGCNPSNIIPEDLSSGAGEYDILKGKAGNDIYLKLYMNLSRRAAEGRSCLFR